jgi:menaquinol-cytochrome c reductase iron-sulfur subunit
MEVAPQSTCSHEAKDPATGKGRRTFFAMLAGLLSLLAAAAAGVPLVGYLLGNRKRTIAWVNLGPSADFILNETRMVTFDNPLRRPWDGMTAQTGVYVRYEGPDDKQQEQFRVLAVNCAHLGCPVTWFPQSGLYLCPCHGGVYYANGERASGPPPRGLFHCVWRLREGNLEIQAPHYPSLHDTLDQPA